MSREDDRADDRFRLQWFENERLRIATASFETTVLFDRSILTLSSAILAVSVGFVSELGLGAAGGPLWALWTSWILFGAAIVLTLLSIVVSPMFNDKLIARLLADLKGEKRFESARFHRLEVLSWIIAVVFAVAIGLTIYFAIASMAGQLVEVPGVHALEATR